MSKKKIPQSKTNMTKKDTTNTDAEHSSTDNASPSPDNNNSLAASIETNKMTSEKDASKTPDAQTEDDKLASLEQELSEVKKAEPASDKATSKNTKQTNSKSKVNSEIKNTAVNSTTTQAKGSNTLSAIALVVACLSIAASAGHYFWQQQQSTQTLSDFKAQNDSVIAASEHKIKQGVTTQLKQALLQQQRAFSAELQQKTALADKTSQQEIAKLTQEINQLETRLANRQPSDWLIHEAEYLIRIAARTMWLEKDTKAAVGLLNDADKRLSELNNPAFLSVRELIHQDIKNLELMPTLQTQETVLALMALNKQVNALPLAEHNLEKTLTNEKNFELSEDINNWQVNLKMSWDKFLSDFFVVRRRTGTVEPLMAPEQQQHLKQNLSLKIQLALWAASQKKTDIYQKTIADIQRWLNEFFDMQAPINQKFNQELIQLKSQTIHFDYPSKLSSLDALRMLINDKSKLKPLLNESTEEEITVQNQGGDNI